MSVIYNDVTRGKLLPLHRIGLYVVYPGIGDLDGETGPDDRQVLMFENPEEDSTHNLTAIEQATPGGTRVVAWRYVCTAFFPYNDFETNAAAIEALALGEIIDCDVVLQPQANQQGGAVMTLTMDAVGVFKKWNARVSIEPVTLRPRLKIDIVGIMGRDAIKAASGFFSEGAGF